MKKIGIVFGGQGSQYQGMGREFLKHPKTKHIYEEIAEYKDIILDGSLSDLSMTKNLQPIMLAFQISALEFLKDREDIVATCGLSLGEYGSLVLAGVLTYKEALSLVKIRGRLMDEDSQKLESKMLAILNKNEDEVKDLILNSSLDEDIFISNINSPSQVLVAGESSKIKIFKDFLKNEKVRSIDMKVSGAFHTRFMKTAGEKFYQDLKKVKFSQPSLDYYLNLSGKKYEGEDFSLVLSQHIYSPVRLFDDIKGMVDQGVNEFIEIGPGDVISKIIKKNFKDLEVRSLKNEEEIIRGEKWVIKSMH